MSEWINRDLKFIWHPYTQMQDAGSLPPILIERAKGLKLYDAKGNFYYDTISSWWCNVHGHNHPRIKQAIKRQAESLEQVLFAGFTHKPAIQLAEKLISLAPRNLAKVFFSDNGSTAVEVALKLSFQYWQNIGKAKKIKFVALDAGYHGDTIGAMSVSGLGLFNAVFSRLFFSAYKVPSPYCYRCPLDKERDNCNIACLNPLENLLGRKSKEICAVIIEPMVLCAAGMIVYPQEYLKGAAQLAKKYGVHLIVDEVATGFGRTGKMFACEYAGDIAPDFLCLSKGITGGYLPLAATLTTDKIYRAFYAPYLKKKTFYHGHTYSANPISCSAALASLSIFQQENTLQRIRRITPLFQSAVERFKELPFVGDVRCLGLIGAIELVRDKKTKEHFNFQERIGFEIYKRGLKDSLVLRPLGDITYLFLPLGIKRKELEDIMRRVYRLIRSLPEFVGKGARE